jgi:hypothetical protein
VPGGATTPGLTEFDDADAREFPTRLVATTLKV